MQNTKLIAAALASLTLLAPIAGDGNVVTWLEKVSGEQYRTAPRASR